MLLEILLPTVPCALYGAAGATVNIVLHWKPMDSALWPLTAHQRGLKEARRPDYTAIGLLEDAMEASRKTELLALAANVAGLDVDPDHIEPVAYGSQPDYSHHAPLVRQELMREYREKRGQEGRKVSGPHPSATCLCGPCESARYCLDDGEEPAPKPGPRIPSGTLRTLDEQLSREHLALDALHRIYHQSPTAENARAIRKMEQRYSALLERKAAR